MAILRTDIERALDELASQEAGMRFQGLAVVVGKKRWPELIAHPRKKDFGLDAYAPSSLTSEKIGKGLAASITPTLGKISGDAKTAKENFPDLKALLFVTPARVGNSVRRKWEETIQNDHDLELIIIEREEIITLMMMPENASLCANFLYLDIDAEPLIVDLINKVRHAADAVTRRWAAKAKGRPLVDLTAVRLDPNGAESTEVLSLEQIDEALSLSRRIVLEGPAGRGKTTMLVQLAQRSRSIGITFMIELPSWTASGRGILEYIAGIPAFQAEGLTANDLARVQQAEPFLLLLNGWNEIAESNSAQATNALRELERDFPIAGIIVATRTHHLTPPLPGAIRLRLLRLQRVQRVAYLEARLGTQGSELRARIDADPSLDELTLTPFVLMEVASLFEAGSEIPSTKLGILDEVLRLQEQRGEHRNSLQSAPIFGRQTDYLKALATEMTSRGTVALPETDSRAVVATAVRGLVDHGQTDPVGAPAVLTTLTAHHILERLDYPHVTFQFEHQQLQEYYAALEVRVRLFDLHDGDHAATCRFIADYINDPAWAEPLCMIAETFAERTGDVETENRNTRVGGKLVVMALAVDPVFAGELAKLCGAAIWNLVRATVGERLRGIYAIRDSSYQQYALAAMLATGADDFSDIIVPLLSGQDQQARLLPYRLWPAIQVSSLGPKWRERIFGWNEQARVKFVSTVLSHHYDAEIAAFVAEDNSLAVKRAAVSALMWTGSEGALTRVLESMDAQAFEDAARENSGRMPAALRSKTIAALRKFIDSTTDPSARLRTALDLIDLGEAGLYGVVKEAMMALPDRNIRNQNQNYIQLVLEYLRGVDPEWVSAWITTKVADGVLYRHEYWLPLVTAIPNNLVERYLQILETEGSKNRHVDGMIAVVAACADANLAARVFAKYRELRRRVNAEPVVRHELEWQVMHQLETVFRQFPDDVATAGILSSVTNGDPLDIRVATELLSGVGRSDIDQLRTGDDDLKSRLRTFLKSSVELVLLQDDFNGEEKADLASSIARVGKPEDMADLVKLIRADIARMRRGRSARGAGDHGHLGDGGSMSYARWHIAAVVHLDVVGAEQVLIDLLPEPEYLFSSTAAMADFVPMLGRSDERTFGFGLMRAAREGRIPQSGDDQRRKRFAAALKAEISRLREQSQDGEPAAGLKELANALAAVDARDSAATVVDVIAMPGEWDQNTCLDAAERLLMAGGTLPATTVSSLLDSVLERTAKSMHQESDRYLLSRVLALCPFVEDPAAGIAMICKVLGMRLLREYHLRELVTALGESRLDTAVDLLSILASDAQTFELCEEEFINAFATLDTPGARELLLAFIDPNIRSIAPTQPLLYENVLVARLTELARRWPEIAARLRELCKLDLPEFNRHVLSKVMNWLGTPEAFAANLNLIDDTKPSPVPPGVWDQLESAFVERRSYRESSNVFTQHPRASNDLRVRLFRMAIADENRRKSAFMLLARIEGWRLEDGRPTSEPRHPDLASGQPWPPKEPDWT